MKIFKKLPFVCASAKMDSCITVILIVNNERFSVFRRVNSALEKGEYHVADVMLQELLV